VTRRFLVVGALAAAVYANALGGAFIYDDVSQIVPNPWLSSVSSAPKLLMSGVWRFSGMATNHFRPAQMLSYLADSVLFGKTPFPFHAHNLLYHVLASLVVVAAVRRWTGSEEAGFAGGLLFSVHPIHVEAVAWIAGMPDVGCGLFYALALLFLMKAQDGRSAAWRAAAAAAFLIALAFKEMAASLLVVWPVVGMSRGGARRAERGVAADRETAPRSGRALVIDVALLGFTFASYLVWRGSALGGLSPVLPQTSLGADTLLKNALWLPVRYAAMAVFPWRLSFAPPYEPVASWLDPRIALAAAALAASALAGVRLWRAGQRPAAAALAMFPLALVPVLDIDLTGWTLIAERYLYVPTIALAALGGAGYAALRSRAWARGPAAAALGVLVLAGAVRTVARNGDFRSDVRLFEATAAQRPDSPRVLFNLARAYEGDARWPEAVAAYRRVIEREPTHAFATANIVRLALQMRVISADEAAARYSEMVSGRNPAPEFLYLYGDVLLLAGRAAEAIEPLTRALAGDPSHLETAVDLAAALDLAGRPRESLEVSRRALAIHPAATGLLSRLAIVSAELGAWADAEDALERMRAAGGDDSRARAAVDSIRAAQSGAAPPPSTGKSP